MRKNFGDKISSPQSRSSSALLKMTPSSSWVCFSYIINFLVNKLKKVMYAYMFLSVCLFVQSRLINCQFMLPGGCFLGPICVLQILFIEESQNCSKLIKLWSWRINWAQIINHKNFSHFLMSVRLNSNKSNFYFIKLATNFH